MFNRPVLLKLEDGWDFDVAREITSSNPRTYLLRTRRGALVEFDLFPKGETPPLGWIPLLGSSEILTGQVLDAFDL